MTFKSLALESPVTAQPDFRALSSGWALGMGSGSALTGGPCAQEHPLGQGLPSATCLCCVLALSEGFGPRESTVLVQHSHVASGLFEWDHRIVIPGARRPLWACS